MTYQSSVQQMQDAGFSGQDIQGWSDNQAVQLRQAGFSQEEVDAHQGMKAPEPGTPPVYGQVPTDKDFHSAASVILGGNDHPFYQKALDALKNFHAQTGATPEDAVKLSQSHSGFQSIIENGGEAPGNYWQEASRTILSSGASAIKGLGEIQSASADDHPLFDIGISKNPEQNRLYQVGSAVQKWIDEKAPAQPAFEKDHPISTGLTNFAANLPVIMATGGLSMATQGADNAYQEAKQAGVTPEKATDVAQKSAALWGVLGVTDVGQLIKPVERAAPGFVPWITAKAMQAVRNGLTFAGTNEFGEYMQTKIAQAADIPAQYKPTLQRIMVNAIGGGAFGVVRPTEVKGQQLAAEGAGKEAPSQEAQAPTNEAAPPSSPESADLTPAYHFDTDTYGVKNAKGEFVQTGLGSEDEATKIATEKEPEQPPSRLDQKVIDRYKKTVNDEAQRLGFNLTPEQLQTAARGLAESHNPEKPSAPAEPESKETPYQKVPAKPLGMAAWARKQGGINDDGGEVRAILGGEKYRPGLISGEGKSIDDMARAAQEAGYMPAGDRPDTNEFLLKLRDDLSGNHQHSDFDLNRVQSYNEALKHNSEIDRVATDTGIDTNGKTHQQFWDEVANHYSEEQQKDLENRAQESWHTEAREPEEMSEEELEHEWQKAKAAYDMEPVSAETGGSGHDATATGPSQAGAGPVERGAEFAGRTNEEDGGRSGSAGGGSIRDEVLENGVLFEKGGLNRGILSARQKLGEFTKEMSDYLHRVLPPEYQAETTEGMINAGGERAYGLTDRDQNLIRLSLQSPDLWITTAHEAFHSVFDRVAGDEKQTLMDEANKLGLRDKYKIDERYKSDQDEETLAHWYADWQKDKADASPKAASIFQKVKDFFSSIAEKVRSFFGNESAEDIFKKIESGEVGGRDPMDEPAHGVAFEKAFKDDEEKPTIGSALRAIRDTFSPTSAGDLAKKEEISIRSAYGTAKRERAIAEAALNEFARQANEMTPEEHTDFYNYVEGRSSGAELKNKQFQGMADTVRDIYETYKGHIQAMPETRMMNFVNDYFTHQWAPGQEEKVKDFMNSWWQQGSGRNLKQRKIPTIAEGLEYGLKLEEPNPVRAVSRYAGSMSNYLASVKVLRSIVNDLGGGYYADGKQPGDYAPLVGRNAERIEDARIDQESGKIVPARSLHLYAPKQVADLYNAFYSKGFEDTKLKQPYELARNMVNANTMLELGLSAYHFSTITMQSINQDVGRILRNAVTGDWQGVGNAIKGLVTPAYHFLQGQHLKEQYQDMADHGLNMEDMANQFAKSNLRLGIDPLANVSTHGGFYKAWQRGELPQVMDRLKSQLTQGYGIGALKSGAEVVSRVISDVAHPLFNTYVPSMKMSAFHDLMGDWLRQHPAASDAQIAENRVRIGDLVEDRFGEMNMENLFWNKKVKQAIGLEIRAPGWDLGLIRQVGGAGVDFYHLLKSAVQAGKGFDAARLDRPLFMVGAVVTYAAINSLMTYIHTGVPPSDQKLKDWIAYATGGLHKAFGMHPERAELPGHGRELIQMAPVPGKGPLSGITQEASNKVATLPKKIWEAATNEDWNGKPIYDPKSKNWYQRTPGVAQAVHIASGFRPFALEQLGESPEGTHLSFAERFLGVRAAGAKIVNPKGLEKLNEQKHH